ncbi:hypothetical protein ACFOD4_09980 [Pseudoroseomonas globiformis]|uniref:Calcium-binding protein n=1 Tax=Teichococcus globiformis TaxID=2307229 RepID=A0ABV7G1I2_9PROT
MAYSLRDILALRQAWSTATDWWDARVTLGTGRADTLSHSGGHHLILGLGGDDIITVQGVYQGLGNAVFGGSGADSVTVLGHRNLVSGDAGHDTIHLGSLMREESNHNIVLGGAGHDEITVFGRDNVIAGGGGNDRIVAQGWGGHLDKIDTTIDGGSGDDWISASGVGVHVLGGAGADHILSQSGTLDPVGTAQTLSGGRGVDSFTIHTDSSLLVENHFERTIAEGSSISGLFTVITDYEAGETIDIGQAGNNRHTSYITVGGSNPEEDPIRLAAHTHAILKGDMTEPGLFVVDEGGDDLIIVYNAADNPVDPARGSLVLQDYAGEITIRSLGDDAIIA